MASLPELTPWPSSVSTTWRPTFIDGVRVLAGFWGTSEMRAPRMGCIWRSDRPSRSRPSKLTRPPDTRLPGLW